jgi:acyl-CoA dehydrogenase
MDFDLNETQRSLQELAERVCSSFDDNYWMERDLSGEFPHDFHQAIAGSGLLGVAMPEDVGGSGLGITEAAILMRTIAQSGAANAASTRPGRGKGVFRRDRAGCRPEYDRNQDPRRP